MRAGWLRWLLEVAAVWLMPWRAVEHAKDLETSVTFMIHVLRIQHEYREDLEVRLGAAAPKPKPRPLHLVLQQGGPAGC